MSATVLKDKTPVMSSEDAIFDDIRPCRDDEAPQELAKIAQDESLITGIVRLRFPTLSKYLGPVLRFFVRRYIHKQLAQIKTIQDFQMLVAKAMALSESDEFDESDDYLDEAEYCSRVSIMADGRIKALDSPAALKRLYRAATMDEVFRTVAKGATRE